MTSAPDPSPIDRAALVAAAKRTIAEGSRSFRLASRLFDKPTRERAWLLYAWCRHCDDVADGQLLGRGGERSVGTQLLLSGLRVRTDRALRGETVGEIPFDAHGIVAAECAIPRRHIEDHLEGFAMDARDWRPRSQQDLLLYCYHVAGVVGCMMAVVMGVPSDDEETLGRACHLGLAFQLANIARDLGEDDAAGRCYIPSEWLAEFDIAPGEQMKPHHRQPMAAIATRLSDLAGHYEASAREGARRLPFRARWAVLAAAGIYGAIGREVARRGPRAWDDRVVVRKRAKLGHVVRAWLQARSREAA